MTTNANVTLPQSVQGTIDPVYVAAFSGDPATGRDNRPSNGVEISSVIDTGRKSTSAASLSGIVNWAATAANSGVVTHIAYFDAATNGKMLYSERLTTPVQITRAVAFSFNVGSRGHKRVPGS